MDSAGTPVVAYTYDSWGKQLSCTGTLASTLGATNPLRYRGYIYDSESGIYYLQSRYYNPDWGRFINADFIINMDYNLISSNTFTYCKNCPINTNDKNGEWPKFLVDMLKNAYSVNDKEANFALSHYPSAKKARFCQERTYTIGKSIFGEDKYNKDDIDANAFRHAFWSAYMTATLGYDMAKQIGDNHEYGQTGEKTEMDQTNNKIGRQIGMMYYRRKLRDYPVLFRYSEEYHFNAKKYGTDDPLEIYLTKKVMQELRAGTLVVINNGR
jgi:RHS repeat-associated protein